MTLNFNATTVHAKTRKEAQIRGNRTYYTGKPCVNGHTAKRRTATTRCISCESNAKRRTVYKHGDSGVKQRLDAILEDVPYVEVWDE